MSASRRTPLVLVAAALVASASPVPVRAFELGDLFRTPEQRAAARLAAGEHEALVENAPDARWEGIGRYARGDAEGAAAAFARALEADGGDAAASGAARDALLYNRATAETRAGRLDTAIALYDELLERDPEHEDARHNRDVARALKALAEQEGRTGESGDEASGERGEGGSENRSDGGEEEAEDDATEGGDESDGREEGAADEAEAGESGSPDESAADGAAAPTGAASGGDGSSDDGPPAGAIDEAEAAEARAAAEAALAAERERAGEDGDAEALGAAGDARTPSEREQATEQWLRRIADDPAGLLRRRLERSHRGDYPEVGDGEEPW